MQEIVSFFKYLAMSNTINFILMIAILAVIVKKMCIKDSLDKSILAVRAAINKSDDEGKDAWWIQSPNCLLYTSPSPRD